ncbi:MAG: helix-turn-helix domain-containing protein [Azoarcus sp.]|jgi:putative transcriptional regulator|nr:helix-turn-helix domain-containing protein [Azoarcus sp.]
MKTKMTDKALAERDARRNIGAELLQAVRDVKAGRGTVMYSSVSEARATTALSQAQFAALMGVSKRTLQDWEQGRRQPSGAAKTLLAVAVRYPDALRELATA